MSTWTKSKLLSLGVTQTGTTPKTSVKDNFGSFIPFIKPAYFSPNGEIDCKAGEGLSEKGLTQSRLIAKNSVLMVCIGATIGKVGYTKVDVSANQQINSFTPSDKIITKFVYYAMLNDRFQRSVIKSSGQATLPIINKTKWSNLEISHPTEIPEQERIVAILDQAFADIEQARAKTEQNLKNARELFESYLQQVFSQRGEGWVERSLEDIVTDDCSLSYGIVQPGDDINGGLPIVRPTDMKKELINLDGLKLIDPSKAEGYKRTSLQGGELLVCVRGTTGTTSIACESLVGANVTRGIVPVRFDPQKISDRFGYYQFISPLIQRQIKAATYGAALMQINIRDFRKIKVCVPPLEVQTVLSDRLDGIRPDLIRIEKIYKLKLSAFDELKKSILQKAFSGELTKTLDGDTSKGAAA